MAVAYDTMCRREELVNLRIEDIAEGSDGSGSVVIRRSKTDTAGEGATAYLSALSMRLVAEWLQSSRRKSGTLFARVLGKDAAGDGFTAQNVTSVLRKVGRWIGLPREEWEKISGHSCRVGAAQDLLALNIDLSSVMQAGRWKDTRMPMRMGESFGRPWRHGTRGQAARARVIIARRGATTESGAATEIPGATRSRASDSPSPGEGTTHERPGHRRIATQDLLALNIYLASVSGGKMERYENADEIRRKSCGAQGRHGEGGEGTRTRMIMQ